MRVKVIVISSTDVEAKKQKEALALNVLASWVQSANLPDISKMIMLREVAASNGMEEMKINVIMPKSPQERLATIENGILLK